MSAFKVEPNTSGPGRRQAEIQESVVVSKDRSTEFRADDIRQAGKGHNPFSGKWLQSLYNYLSGRFQRQEEMFVHLAKENASLHGNLVTVVSDLKKAIAEAASITSLRKEAEALRAEKARLLAEIAEVHEKLRQFEAVAHKMDEAASTIQAAKASYVGVLPSGQGPKGLAGLIAGGKAPAPKLDEQPKKEGPPAGAGNNP